MQGEEREKTNIVWHLKAVYLTSLPSAYQILTVRPR